ncbi:MAG: EamA family transporter [Clostridiales bacterium]|nr:MAG: EamA family transporter [Clostridiales bacterium]
MNTIRKNLFPVLAALIWGTAFVAQSVGAGYVPPFAFNTVRSLIAAAALLLAAFLFSKVRKEPLLPPRTQRKDLLLGGFCCGAILTVASGLQQAGLSQTSAGKAGFITALYIVLVPVFGIFLKKRAPFTVWIAVLIAAVGLYFLCVKERFAIEKSDLLILLCAVAFACHILTIDHFTAKVDGVRLSCLQFFVVAILSGLFTAFFEQPVWSNFQYCIGPLLYAGIFSSGIAYTLQIIAQRGANPTVVSLLLSLESVFSVLAGALLLGDRLTGRELFGCLLMLAAVVFAQLAPLDRHSKKV